MRQIINAFLSACEWLGNLIIDLFFNKKRKRKNRARRKKVLPILLVLLPLLTGLTLYSLSQVKKTEAAWWDEGWIYRKSISIDNTGSVELTKQITPIILDTETLIAAGKLQNDCSDLRITDQDGNLLEYWISGHSGYSCNNTTSYIYPKFNSLGVGENILFVYYGSPITKNVELEIGTSIHPALSCQDIIDHEDSKGDGLYFLAPDGNTNETIEAYCEMTTDSGGWTLIISQQDNIIISDYFSISPRTDNNGAIEYYLNNDLKNISEKIWVINHDDESHVFNTTDFTGPLITNTSNFVDAADVSTMGLIAGNNYPVLNHYQVGQSCSSENCHNTTISSSTYCNPIGQIWDWDEPDSSTNKSNHAHFGCKAQIEISWAKRGKNLYVKGFHNFSINASQSVNSEEVTPGPIAYWKFDEGSDSTAYDSSSQENNGTISTATWAIEESCISGKCLDFTGYANVSISNSNTLNFDTNDFTISAWALHRDYAYPKSGFMIKKSSTCYTDNHPGFDLGHGYDYDGIDVCFRDVNNNLARGSLTFDTNSQPAELVNQWVHYVFVFDRTNEKLLAYINGVKQSNEFDISAVTDSINNTSPIAIGTMYGWQTDGLMDEIKIYPYARSAKQIKSDYVAGSSIQGSSAVFGHQSETAEITPISSKLIAHYKFDEGSGVTTNDSAGTNDGTVSGATWTNDGKIGKALSFSSADVNSTLETNINNSSFTISGWVFADILDTDRCWLGLGSAYATNSSIHLRIKSNGTIHLGFYSNDLYTNPGVFSSETWQHLAYSYNLANGERKIYLNGEEVASDISSSPFLGNASLKIGNWASQPWIGKIDEVKIYNQALTVAEILQDYNLGMGTVMGQAPATDSNSVGSAAAQYCIPGDTSTCRAPVTEWLFDENQGSNLNDNSGSENIGSLMNNPSWSAGKTGGALTFNGTDNYVSFNKNVIFAKPAMSVSAWFKTTDANGAIAAQYQNSSGYSWQLNIVSGLLKACVGTSNSDPTCRNTTYQTESTSSVDDGEWHYGSFSYDGTNIYLYLDGQKIATTAKTGNIANPASSLTTAHIGVQGYDYGSQVIPQNAGYLDGSIDQVRIYDYARTPAQVTWDYDRGEPIGHWRLDECQGDLAHDVSNNGFDGDIIIGATGTQTTTGTCNSEDSSAAWYNGRNGHTNASLSFDDIDDYVNIPSNDTLRFIGSDFTVSSWAYLPASNNGGLVYKGQGTIRAGYGFYQVGSNIQFIYSDTSTTYDHVVSLSSIIGRWFHAVSVIDKTNNLMSVYIDGNLEGSLDITGINEDVSGSNALQFGKSGSFYSSASIDEVRIYNYALTSEQIKLLYNNNSAVRFEE